MTTARKRIAVIGAGISGLAAAYFLNRRHDVVLFEAGSYLGGHANTVDITLDGQRCAVDTGFLVYNDKTYPNLIALFDELGVASIASDMSFGVSMDDGALEWAGTNLDTVFAQRRRLLSPAFLGMLRDILHFNGRAEDFLAECESMAPRSASCWSAAVGAMFRDAYLLPMAAAIWSSSPQDILRSRPRPSCASA
jgi:predicted NAD/FAD-binding protein